MSGTLDFFTNIQGFEVFGLGILSVVIFIPLLGALTVFFIKDATQAKVVTLVFMLVDFVIALPLMFSFDKTTAEMQFVERGWWIKDWKIEYYLGIDGISVLFIFLTTLIGIVCVLASWSAIETRVKEYMICLLAMQTFMIGVFCALDFILFYVFWEAMLIPMYLIIGVWGGTNRIYSAVKFFLYTLAGSVLLLIGILALYFESGGTFDIPHLMTVKFAFTLQVWVFVAFFIAFAIKVPMFPFHTWLPDAHVQAPTAGSIILAGILLKMGTYGMLRFSMPMLPDASQYFATAVIVLSLIAIIYGAYLALAQEDIKKLIAYSSVSHMGFITLGMFAFNTNAMEGAILQMFNHGITSGALFLCVGIIYERTHTREISKYGWGASRVPFYTTFFLIFSLASLGFPGTNGFIGEMLILFGAYENSKPYLFFLLIGIVLGAAYSLWLFKRIAYGVSDHSHGHGDDHAGSDSGDSHGDDHKVWDINFRETVALSIFLIFVFWIGFQPMDFLDYMHVSVDNLLGQVGAGTEAVVEAVEAVNEAVTTEAVEAHGLEAETVMEGAH